MTTFLKYQFCNITLISGNSTTKEIIFHAWEQQNFREFRINDPSAI